MHVFTLLHRNMGKYKIACGDTEMAKQRLGQARNMDKPGFFSSHHIIPENYLKNLN